MEKEDLSLKSSLELTMVVLHRMPKREFKIPELEVSISNRQNAFLAKAELYLAASIRAEEITNINQTALLDANDPRKKLLSAAQLFLDNQNLIRKILIDELEPEPNDLGTTLLIKKRSTASDVSIS